MAEEPDSAVSSSGEDPPGDGVADLSDGDVSESPDGNVNNSPDGDVSESDAGTSDSDADASGRDAEPADQDAGTSDHSADPSDHSADPSDQNASATGGDTDVPSDVRKYERFKKMDGAQYDRVNEFLRDRTYITAREWAIARLCADFRTETGVEMTKIGENLPELVPFMTDTYTPQAVNQARSSFEDKVRKSGATFLYGAMCGFFTAEELDEMMYDVTEIAKFLLEVEGVDLAVEDELEAEERISSVMREVREASDEFRQRDVEASED